MNFVLDHSAPEEMRDLVNDKNDTMSISILNLVAVEWMYRINTDLPRKVQEHFTDQLQDGKTSLAQLVPKIIEQLKFLLTQEEEMENTQITENKTDSFQQDEEKVEASREVQEEEEREIEEDVDIVEFEQDSSADENDNNMHENEDLELERDSKRRFFCQTCNNSFLYENILTILI